MADIDKSVLGPSSLEELRATQLKRLQWSLKHAYDKVPFYKNAFDQAGLKPSALKDMDDLAKFPFTTKQDLRDHYPFGMFAVPREEIARIHASSGTTGKPTVVGYTKEDIETWATVVARAIHAAGGRPGDICHVAYGYGLFTGGLGAHYGAEKLGCTVIPMSGGQTEKQIQLIQDFKPKIIMVTPSYFLNILDVMEQHGIDPRTTSLEIGIFGAEPWTNEMRQAIEQRANISAVDIYGLSEVMGPGVAQEYAQTKDGPTIFEDHFYPEIIDPETGGVVPDGQEGELVFTTLTKEAMPVIRYRTRDLTRLLPGQATPMRRMDKITGRSDDMLIIRGVNVFPTQIEEQLLAIENLTPHYQIEVFRKSNLDSINVNVELTHDASGCDEKTREKLAKQLQHNIKTFIGVSSIVSVGDEGCIPRSEGKAQRVVDRR